MLYEAARRTDMTSRLILTVVLAAAVLGAALASRDRTKYCDPTKPPDITCVP